MDRSVQLYVKGGIDTANVTYEYERIELFDFEDINITNKIQDVRDISKVFTDYSQQFTVPASRNNNKVFKHYYNWNITGGFDARVKLPAIIKINGVNYREGRLSLTGSSLKKNQPYSYSVVFYGKTVSLKELIGDDLLDKLGTKSIYNDLDPYLDKFRFSYNYNTVRNGLNKGFNLVNGVLDVNSDAGPDSAGDLCFPFISGSSLYFYDPADGDNPRDRVDSRNIHTGATTTPKGVYYKDLKPSIRVYHIIKAIERKYGIEFTDDFFSQDNKPFYDLHMLMHREKGDISSQIDFDSRSFRMNEFTYEGFTCILPETNCGGRDLREDDDQSIIRVRRAFVGDDESITTIKYTITVGASDEYRAFLKDGLTGDLIDTVDGGRIGIGSRSFLFRLNHLTGPEEKDMQPIFIIESQGSVTTFDIDMEIQDTVENDFLGTQFDFKSNYTELTSLVLGEGLFISSQLPKMKTIDFLTSIFKTFNLTAYYVPEFTGQTGAGMVKVRTLDDYYNYGKVIDISKYVDTENTGVNRDKLYSTIDMEFQKPITFAIYKSNELTYDEFGNERINNTHEDIESPLAFDGGKYKVKLGFDKVMYERMSDQSDESITDIQWGWLVNKDENPVLTKPLIYYPIKQYSSQGILFDNGVSTQTLPNNNYIRPSNALKGLSESINFGNEFDEWEVHEGLGINDNSLFRGYYKNYILRIYNEQSRRVKIDAHFPLGIVTSLELNDCLRIGGDYFNISSMNLNLSNGKAELELINNAKCVEAGNVTLDRPTIGLISSTTTTLNIRVLSNLSFDNLVHDIYVDGVLTLSDQSSRDIEITSLTTGTTYDIRAISKINGTNIESFQSSTYEMTTD